MPERKPHQVWIEQCEAAQTIRTRFGVTAAFDYLVGEKLLNFAEAAVNHPDFARELPRFISEVRRMFPADETEAQLAKIERLQNEETADPSEADDPFGETPAEAAERSRRLNLIKELLTATKLGTS